VAYALWGFWLLKASWAQVKREALDGFRQSHNNLQL